MAGEATNPRFNTYHCICTQFLLATTQDIATLPRRGAPAIDKAFILPLAFPKAANQEGQSPPGDAPSTDGANLSSYGYSVLTSTVSDRRPIVIRREDGFEKRTLVRCERCKLVIGYRLGETPYSADGERAGHLDVIYILPGSLATTEEMQKGEMPEEEQWEVEAV